MRWFWRATIAVALGSIPCCGIVLAKPNGPAFLRPLAGMISEPVAIWMLLGLPASLVSVLAFSALTRRKQSIDSETRCRKCNYILRGISEPRCPECGERI
jgi:hypothetical protein